MGRVQGILGSPGIELGNDESKNLLGESTDRWNSRVLQRADGRKGELQLLLKVA